MNILSLKIFNLLKARKGKLTSIMEAKNDAAKLAELSWTESNPSTYTMVDAVPGGRKVDMMVHMGSKQFDQSREWHVAGKSHWHKNATVQHYKPRTVKADPQLEFMYEELGLSQNLEQTQIGPPKQGH